MAYLEVAGAIEIHLLFMERTGARSQGIRARDELETAVARPKTAAFYAGADIIRQAPVLAIGLSQKQPFVDGNQPTAFAATDALLRLNGYRTVGNGVAFAKQLEAVAERDDSLDEATDRFETWLRANVQSRQ